MGAAEGGEDAASEREQEGDLVLVDEKVVAFPLCPSDDEVRERRRQRRRWEP